jgi:hypothetical protein
MSSGAFARRGLSNVDYARSGTSHGTLCQSQNSMTVDNAGTVPAAHFRAKRQRWISFWYADRLSLACYRRRAATCKARRRRRARRATAGTTPLSSRARSTTGTQQSQRRGQAPRRRRRIAAAVPNTYTTRNEALVSRTSGCGPVPGTCDHRQSGGRHAGQRKQAAPRHAVGGGASGEGRRKRALLAKCGTEL